MKSKTGEKISPILKFWGKARSSNPTGASTHSVAYHCLDVAAVASELLAHDRDRLKRIAAAVGIKVNALTGALPFLLALHDIGKYARVFQAKSPDHWPTNVLGPYRDLAPGNSHVVTGFQMLVAFSDSGHTKQIFDRLMPGWSASERKIIFRALAGHHGRPPQEGERSSFGPQDVCIACEKAGTSAYPTNVCVDAAYRVTKAVAKENLSTRRSARWPLRARRLDWVGRDLVSLYRANCARQKA
jgi:CRISPR-associated endonuclease Cas3-HD